MYLILTASKDTYITNKIISNGVSASSRASSSITIAGGALDVNVKIRIVTTDLTEKTYVGITEDHGSLVNGEVLAAGDNPDGNGNMGGDDDRIGMIAFMVGSNPTDAANMLQIAINSSSGHNLGVANKKIQISNNGSGKLDLIQSEPGSAGNTSITVTGDTNSRITIPNTPAGFIGGRNSAPIRATDANLGRAGTLDLFKLYGENDVTGESDAIELSRALLKFDYTSLIPLMSKSLDIHDATFKCYLKLKDLTTGRATPTNVTLMALPLSKSFEEGIGRSVSTFNDIDVSNFLTASYVDGSLVTWTSEGANATGSSPGTFDALTATQTRAPFAGAPNSTPANTPTTVSLKSTFEIIDGGEDASFDVTNAVSASLKSDIANHGFRISMEESEENNAKTYFIKRFGSRHVRNTRFRPELHIAWDDSTRDDLNNVEFNVDNKVYLTNFSKGIPKNIVSGTIAGSPPTTTLSNVAGNNCMKLILSKSLFKKTYNVSQVLNGTGILGQEGKYSTTFNIDLFSSNNLYGSSKASTSITILNGAIDLNTKITLKSTDGTILTYVGITEDHSSLVNGEILAIGDNPDGAGAIQAGDERIGMRAFMIGTSNADAATTLAIAINNANGHNAGTPNSKITIIDNKEGILTLEQTLAGSAGNTEITILGDSSRRIRLRNNIASFTGGCNATTLEEVGRVSGSLSLKASWVSNDETVVYHDGSITLHTSSIGHQGRLSSKPILSMTNLKDVYNVSDTSRIRVFAFDQNIDTHAPVKVPHSRKAQYLGDLYWRLINETAGYTIVDFQIDSNTTKLSYDSEGYYFDFDMGTPPVGSTCRFEFARKHHDEVEFLAQKRFARFRVTK